ncbi:hypothetical protein FA13DRAFT_1774451 [Coprinellus micaceus]|uniref:Uncharacterized protein n=1 Tax=Coprinellus micaceus TaxID=71717 RepID=A0A4Y7TAP7_COPMI|nr:hypothetical protein FA13DRAFT_1774451 [Coprinellus micaceus]
MSSPPSTIPALSTPNHISTVPAPTTGETNTTSEPFTVPGVGTDAATTTTGTSTEVDSKAAEEAIKSIDEQLAEQPKEAGVGEKQLKGAEEEAGKEAKKAKVAEAVDAGTAPVEAKAGETTEAPPAKGGAKRGRGRGGKAAKAAPAQGTRKSARGKGAAAGKHMEANPGGRRRGPEGGRAAGTDCDGGTLHLRRKTCHKLRCDGTAKIDIMHVYNSIRRDSEKVLVIRRANSRQNSASLEE